MKIGNLSMAYAKYQRIAELESRTVTVKLASRRLPSDYVDGEFGNDDLAAQGIVVKWEAE